MNKDNAELIKKWSNAKMGKLWILIVLLCLWPFGLMYFFLHKWPSQLSVDELNEYNKYLELKKNMKK